MRLFLSQIKTKAQLYQYFVKLLSMIDLDNKTTLPINLKALNIIASTLSSKEVELIIVDNREIQNYNKEYRDKDTPTDVLSFPFEIPFRQSISDIPLGSIMISDFYVREKSLEFGHSIEDELSILFIHGILHLLGFNHEIDNGEMREREKEIIEQFSLPKTLIIRTQED